MEGTSSRRTLGFVLGGLLVALLGALGGYALAGSDGSSDERVDSADASTSTTSSDDSGDDSADDGTTTTAVAAPIPAPEPIATDGLTGAALELAEAINRAGSLTYHAVYSGSHASSSGSTSEVTVEIWRQLPLARRDTSIKADTGTLSTRELRLADQLLGCVDTSKGDTEPAWICLPAAGKGVDPADPVLGRATPTDGAVAARDDEVAGEAARCFTVTEADGTVQEACFDLDGIPLSIDGGDGRLVRSEVGRGVDPAVVAIPEGAEMRSGDAPA
jgi:hypothetical protein